MIRPIRLIPIIPRISMIPLSLFLILPILSPAQGPLDPSGPPGPTMKTLDQIEPRLPLKASDFPVTITSPSTNYYLTENVSVSLGAGVNAITINANNVTIDLNGYTLSGNGLNGIICIANATNITVRNGVVQQWSGSGIDLSPGQNCKVMGVSARGNGVPGTQGTGGILVGNASIVSDCMARENVGDGIRAGDNAIISRCAASSSYEASGIVTGAGSTIDACTAEQNNVQGFRTLSYCSLSRCTARGNGAEGYSSGSHNSIVGCIAGGNDDGGFFFGTDSVVTGCVASNNLSDGFFAGGGATITDCMASDNLDDGFVVQFGNMVSHCTSQNNLEEGFVMGFGTITNCTAIGNGSHGISVFNRCLVLANSCTGNGAGDGTGAGINIINGVDEASTIEGNLCALNDIGIRTEGTNQSNLIIRNTATRNPSTGPLANYSIGAGNTVGEILSAAGGTISSSNPWANIEF